MPGDRDDGAQGATTKSACIASSPNGSASTSRAWRRATRSWPAPRSWRRPPPHAPNRVRRRRCCRACASTRGSANGFCPGSPRRRPDFAVRRLGAHLRRCGVRVVVARTGAATRRRRTAWRRPRRTRGAPPARDAPRPPRFFAVAWGGTWPGRPPIALTIADSDPSGGAGIQAELKTFHRHGVYGQTVLRLLTAQDTRGVQGVFVQPVDVVRAQLHSVADELEARPPVPWSSIRCWSASTATHSPAAAAAARHRGDAEPLRSRSAHRHRGHRPDVGAGGGAPAAGPGTA